MVAGNNGRAVRGRFRSSPQNAQRAAQRVGALAANFGPGVLPGEAREDQNLSQTLLSR